MIFLDQTLLAFIAFIALMLVVQIPSYLAKFYKILNMDKCDE